MPRTALIAVLLLAVAFPAGAAGKGLDTQVSVNFLETPLRDALAFLAQTTKVHIVIDPAAKADAKKLTANLKEVTARSALSILTSTVGLAWDERWGGVFVATKKRLEALSKDRLPQPAAGEEKEEDLALRRRLPRLQVIFNFAETPVTECLNLIGNYLKLNIILDDSLLAEAERSLFNGAVSGISFGDALALILVPRGLTADIRHGIVFVRKAGERKAPPKREKKENVPKVFDETKLALKFDNTALATVVDFLGRTVKYPIHLDPRVLAGRATKSWSLSIDTVKEITVRQALDLVAMGTGLDWDVRWGGVFVASKERLATLPKSLLPAEKAGEMPAWETVLRKTLAKQRISFDFADQKLVDVLSFIRDSAGVNILVTPKAAKAASNLKVDLRLAKRPLREALTLLLVPRGFTFDLSHEVVVVRVAK